MKRWSNSKPLRHPIASYGMSFGNNLERRLMFSRYHGSMHWIIHSLYSVALWRLCWFCPYHPGFIHQHWGNLESWRMIPVRPSNPDHITTTQETHIYRQFSNIRRTQSQKINVSRLVLQLSLPNPLKPGVVSWEWRCSWSSVDRRCSNYIWVIVRWFANDFHSWLRLKILLPTKVRLILGTLRYIHEWGKMTL